MSRDADRARADRELDDRFLDVVAGRTPATIVHADDLVVAFEDIAPVAPVHVLVVPRVRYVDVTELARAAPATLARLVEVAQLVADERCGGEFRLVFNTGWGAMQRVFHVHGHVLGGSDFHWPPAAFAR